MARRSIGTRVVQVQAQAARSIWFSIFFLAAAGISSITSRQISWVTLHLVFVGGLLTAISGATQLFAVTWASAPAPASWAADLQRALIVSGAILAIVGGQVGARWLVFSGSALVVMALSFLAAILFWVVRNGRLRRFDCALRYYLVALACGIVGVFLIPVSGGGGGRFRQAHAALNLLGLVGIVIAGTLPFFMATEARVKMSPRATPRRQMMLLLVLGISTGIAAISAIADLPDLWSIALISYGVGVAGALTLLPRIGKKQLRWAGPRLLQIISGIAWWAGAVLAAGIGRYYPIPRDLIGVLAIGGYLQILLGAVAYIAPVLRGGGHTSLREGFHVTRSWEALVLVNLAAVLLTVEAAFSVGPSIGLLARISLIGGIVCMVGRLIRLAVGRQSECVGH